jgi:hypothetical protein
MNAAIEQNPVEFQIQDKLNQIEDLIWQMKQAQSKRQVVQPWDSRPKPVLSHPLLKEKAS